MNYKEFYSAIVAEVNSQSGTPQPVPFEFMRSLITADRSLVEQIDVLRIAYKPPIGEARFTLFDERESRHDDPIYYAEISFCSSLDDQPKHLLYALTKELMHVFDPMETWIDTREKFVSFLRDLQNKPLEIENGSIAVEHKARWMAVLALCPTPIRKYIKNSIDSDGVLKAELAQELDLPTAIIDIALDDYYEQAREIMLA